MQFPSFRALNTGTKPHYSSVKVQRGFIRVKSINLGRKKKTSCFSLKPKFIGFTYEQIKVFTFKKIKESGEGEGGRNKN